MLTLTPVVAFALAFGLALALTPLVVRIAVRLGAVDLRCPNKIHAGDIPRLGGLAIACGFYVPVLGLLSRRNLFSEQIYREPSQAAVLLGGGLAILGLGVYDDLYGATAWQKLIIQIPVAVFAWWAGMRIGATSIPGIPMLHFGAALSLAATVLWVVLVVNALNLIDGLDGLSSGIALLALCATALCAYHRQSAALGLFAICLAGAVAGFLVHNFHPASIFMGDSGSMFLGYVLAIASVWSSQKAATTVGFVLPALILGVPLFDTGLAILRRLRRPTTLFTGDLDHIHHRLLRLGWSQRRSVLTLYAISFGFDAVAVALVLSGESRYDWPLVAISVIVAFGLSVLLGALKPADTLRPAEVSLKRRRSRV